MGPLTHTIPMVLYHSHKNPSKYRNGMGIVWEAYHKRVPLLGVPGISLEYSFSLMLDLIILV